MDEFDRLKAQKDLILKREREAIKAPLKARIAELEAERDGLRDALPRLKVLTDDLKAKRTAWHESYGVPVSWEYAAFLEAIGKVTEWAERALAALPDPPKGEAR